MKKRRITVAEVVEAYRLTGLRPVRQPSAGTGHPGQGYFNYRRSGVDVKPECGCALGALFLAQNTQAHWSEATVCAWSEMEFDRNYRWGFVTAFDGHPIEPKRAESEYYQLGYKDGTDAAAAVFSQGL